MPNNKSKSDQVDYETCVELKKYFSQCGFLRMEPEPEKVAEILSQALTKAKEEGRLKGRESGVKEFQRLIDYFMALPEDDIMTKYPVVLELKVALDSITKKT